MQLNDENCRNDHCKRTWIRFSPHQNGKAPLKYLEEKWEVNVLGVSNDGKQIHVESRLGLDEQCTMEADQQHLAIQAIDDPVITVSTELENKTATPSRSPNIFPQLINSKNILLNFGPNAGGNLLCHNPQIGTAGSSFAKSTWSRNQKFMVTSRLHTSKRLIRRYTKTSARGPDGFSRRDLQWMPSVFQEELVRQLNTWETQGCFPTQLHTGFVHPLPKKT